VGGVRVDGHHVVARKLAAFEKDILIHRTLCGKWLRRTAEFSLNSSGNGIRSD